MAGLCDELVDRITQGAVTDATAISKEFSERIGHLAQVDAINMVEDGAVVVGPIRARALMAYESPAKRLIEAATVRPVELSDTELQVGSRRVTPEGGTKRALAYYDLYHPYTDFVSSMLPTVPPPLSSEPAVYEFIGHRFNDTLIMARAKLLQDAADALLNYRPPS